MANDDEGNGRVEVPAGTELILCLESRFGAVIAASYELVMVGDPPVRMEQRRWNTLDFYKTNPRTWPLPNELGPGRYLCTIVPVLQPPKTELEIALLLGGAVVFRRTAFADEPTYEGIASFSLTIV
ncbi:MAG: hypothetical protein KDI66_19745 [Xanthomonadales bacterium]|nr:hypothetical protein [Xanthomonadales bacterium]